MTREERTIIAAVNVELKRRGSPRRLAANAFYPLYHDLDCDLEHSIVRVCADMRSVEVFVRERGNWGHTEHIGTYRGHGWLAAMVKATADAITDQE